MGHDDELADRVRAVLAAQDGLTERRMFGGLGFMLDGHMVAAASSTGGLLLRIDPTQADRLVDAAGVTRSEMRGREMDGWLDVSREVVRDDASLARWVGHGIGYVRSLPPKAPRAR